MAAAEPAFANGTAHWPLAGLRMPDPEPDDPGIAIPHDAILPGSRDAAERAYLIRVPPIAPRVEQPMRGDAAMHSSAARMSVLASFLLHAAVALVLVSGVVDAVLVEGSQDSGVAFLGNAPDDQLSSGEPVEATDVTQVTMITMLEARPVEIIDAETAPVEETVERVAPAEAVETVKPETAVADAETPPRETERLDAVAPDEATPVEAEPAPAAASVAPEVLAVDRIAPAEDENTVPPPVERLAAVAVEAEPARPAEAPKAAAEAPVETVEPAPEVAEAKPAEPKPAPVAKKAEPKKQAAKPAEKPAPEKPARKTAKSSGNGGPNEADARRGSNDGRADGKSAGANKGRASAAGNAAVSNYPGKVAAKLRRALRYPSEARREKLRGEVRVGFTVSASGGVGSVRIVRSSGSPVLDRAALDTVRRAAPFPAIPDGAGRSTWPFVVPLAFSR